MRPTHESQCVAIFPQQNDARAAIRCLRENAFDITKLSMLGNDCLGPMLAGGVIGSALGDTAQGAAIGALVGEGTSVFAAVLASLGLPPASVLAYEAELNAEKFLLIASGTASEVVEARQIIARSGHPELRVHVH